MTKSFIAAMAALYAISANAGVLADKETMRKQLTSVTDDPYLAEKYFPSILAHANSEKVPLGIVMMFTLADADFESKVLRGMPLSAKAAVEMNLESLVP